MVAVQYAGTNDTEGLESIRVAYETVIEKIGPGAATALNFGSARLAFAVRRAADRSADTSAPGRTADAWLGAHIGPVDDTLRRAAVAALVLGLKPDVRTLPGSILALYPEMHRRLLRFLEGPRSYDVGAFAKDIALAAGAAAPVGALTVEVPSLSAGRFSLGRIRRAAAGYRRQRRHHGAQEALHWLKTWGLAPWAELHMDTRNLREFNAAGFQQSYRRLAALMALRPDLAGVYGASWLYQPELSDICPNLAFTRETAQAGGGRLVRLRADPVQTAYAIARSPLRQRLFMSGEYRPVCYGMFWARGALMDWAQSASPASAAPLSSPSNGRRRR